MAEIWALNWTTNSANPNDFETNFNPATLQKNLHKKFETINQVGEKQLILAVNSIRRHLNNFKQHGISKHYF